MAKSDIPVTPAIRVLRQHNATFDLVEYDYEEKGGTRRSSTCLGVDEHAVVKTLVLEVAETKAPFIILMHGDREISTKQMARVLNVKTVQLCNPETANKHTGYMVGGTSPFDTRKELPIYAEATIFELPEIWINAGRRGLLARMPPANLETILKAQRVSVATV